MDNNLVLLKLKQRLNKLSSNDFTNIECWQAAELINKGQLSWVRRNLHGGNMYKEGDEQSVVRIDDMQILLTQKELKGSKNDTYFETETLPDNYLKFKRLTVWGKTKDCDERRKINVALVEEANVDDLLIDYLLKPSFKWAETFATLIGNKSRIYTNNEFYVVDCHLTYYRFPRQIVFEGCRDWNDNVGSEQTLEFKDDIVELIIDEAVKIAAADINDYNNFSRQKQGIEENN